MDVLMIALGSAGDVHPLLGLGLALRDRGHRVTLATNPYFESLVRRAGVDFAPVGTVDDFHRAMEDPDLWHPQRAFRLVMRELIVPQLRPLYEMVAQRFVPGETVVVAAGMALGARVAQDRLGVPLATVHLQPAVIRSAYQSPCLPPLLLQDWVPRAVKRFQFWAADKFMIDRVLGPPLNEFRAELGLPPAASVMGSWWNSPQLTIGLFPDWFAPPQPDWPRQLVLTGFPLWDEEGITPVPLGVEEFLSAGEPPVVFTPGSAMLHGHKFFAAAVEACRLLGRRGILLTRFAQQLPQPLPERVRHFDFVPLGSLLPRAAAIVHHGGIGTVAQGLAAGIPHLAMPMSHDQPDNAARLVRLGVGTSLKPNHFQGAVVAKSLERLLTSAEVRKRAQELSGRIDTRAARAQTCRLIEGLARMPSRTGSASK